MYIKVIVELAAGVLLCNQSVWVMVSIVELDNSLGRLCGAQRRAWGQNSCPGCGHNLYLAIDRTMWVHRSQRQCLSCKGSSSGHESGKEKYECVS